MRSSLLLFAFLCYLSRCGAQELVLFEDFSGDTLNEEVWNVIQGNGCPDLCGWGNNELQVYTDTNHELRDGKLVITARKEGEKHTSTRLNTKGKLEFQYGTVEIRAQLPRGKGLWPAFWMLGSNIDTVGWPACGEIDILEYVGREPGMVFTSLHTTSSHGNTVNTKKTALENIEEGYHDYSMTWTPEHISFSVDGETVYKYSPELKNNATWPFDQPYYLLVNLAIGGNFGGHEVDDTIFPASYVIDHIKVWQD
ncbi:glycoside hydrolase family 16 protein [Robertkochia flava]|uniref:glycoside hydrolase family 16 protein n=1 Tax=Robertkochia flava TaxID=3447986 RepID=UPI001CCA63E7|nr:glycoside hydrolase family 16 protein [Robertkochia marina]